MKIKEFAFLRKNHYIYSIWEKMLKKIKVTQ